MTRITRYITRQLALGIVFVTLGLMGILWLTQSLRFIELVLEGSTNIWGFIYITMLVMPGFLSVVLPISLFAVVLFTFNKLSTDRELVVMQAAGLSPWQLGRAAVILGAVVSVICYVLTIQVSPAAMRDFRELKWEIRHDMSSLLLSEGVFNEVSNGLTVFVRESGENGQLEGLFVHDTRDPQRSVTMVAERGALIHDESGPRVLMVNGSRQEVRPRDTRSSILFFDTYSVRFGDGAPGGQRHRDASERPLFQLLTLPVGNGLSGTHIREFRVEGHQRLTQPLFGLGFAMIALGVLLNGQFRRRGQMQRIVAAIALMVALQSSGLLASNLAAGNLMFVPLLYLFPLAAIGLGGGLLWRAGRARSGRRQGREQPA